ELLQRLWRNRPRRGLLLHLSADGEQGVERGPGFLQEPGIIANVLNGSIDFVGNASRQLPNRLQFLRLPQLLSQNLALRDIGADDQQLVDLFLGPTDPGQSKSQKSCLAIDYEREGLNAPRLSVRAPAINLHLHIRAHPLDTA